MSQCAVMRCTGTGTVPRDVGHVEGIPLMVTVCVAHDQRMDTEPWRLDLIEGYILIGEDI